MTAYARPKNYERVSKSSRVEHTIVFYATSKSRSFYHSTSSAFQFLDYVVEVSRSWEEPIVKEPPRDRTMNRARASGVYSLLEGLDVQAKFATIMRRLDDLEAKRVQEKNPRGVNEVFEVQKEDCNVVITLKNGKEYEWPKLPVSEDIPVRDEPTVEKNARNEKMSKKYEEVIMSKDKMSISNHLPFPLAMQRHKVEDKTLEILKVLKQVKINIPLLDMIKQVPTYAKFLKDLCTMKKMIKLSKKTFLIEQVSAIIKNKVMVKNKDPGCPTISVQIGDSFVERALLDLGDNVNLLPYSIYKQLGLGELMATTITLSLADRLIKVSRGVIQDVLVQVEKFYYPMDFVLSFGNMIVEMNVFNLCKQPMDHDDVENEEACLIEALVQEHTKNSWVSPIQVVPKKNRIIVVKNDEGKLIPTRLTTVTKKDDFPLPFLDQVLERVAGHNYYCFLDGYLGYFQIGIALEDQEKTTFTRPFGTYAYKRMPFGLCNAPTTF
uniref:Reverse transcriptase domain-containing protein n=1 Tax=Vitis vinifera TaxID=29760 RepID=A5BIB9_VITVI|nr:hypothetical protein VITISV_027710 [Vitis vinifera]